MLSLLRKSGLLPGLLSQNYFVYLIYLMNKEPEDSKIWEAAVEYTRELALETKSEFQLLKVWKQKVLADKYYKEGKLEAFLSKLGEKQQVYKLFVDKIE